jgi:hypothetical protein
MKGTIGNIVGQESGFIVETDFCSLDNWASNLTEYSADLRRTKRVENCLIWLIRAGYLDFDVDEAMKKYREDANPVSMKDLMTEGVLYYFDGFKILAPDGWN